MQGLSLGSLQKACLWLSGQWDWQCQTLLLREGQGRTRAWVPNTLSPMPHPGEEQRSPHLEVSLSIVSTWNLPRSCQRRALGRSPGGAGGGEEPRATNRREQPASVLGPWLICVQGR